MTLEGGTGMCLTSLTFEHSFPAGALVGEFGHTYWISVRPQSNKDGTETWSVDPSEDFKVREWLEGKGVAIKRVEHPSPKN
ncbi:MAG: hypothetical protein KJI69_01510 [Patescibacteria group bacterium]|nr:hypothetical protein [Patescibacteria group bacterium]